MSRAGQTRKAASKHKEKGGYLASEIKFQQGNIDTYWKFKAYSEGTAYRGTTGPQTTSKMKNLGYKQRTGLTQSQRDAGFGKVRDVFTFWSPEQTARKEGYSTQHKKGGTYAYDRWAGFRASNWEANTKTYKGIANSHKIAALEADLGKLDAAKSARAAWEGNPFDASKVKSPLRKGRMGAVLLKNQGDSDVSIAAKMKAIETQYATQYYDDPSSSNYGKMIEGTDKSDYIARVKAALVSTKINNNKTITPNVSKGGQAYNQFAEIDKDRFNWESGELGLTKGTGEVIISNYVEHDNFANIQSVREPTAAEKADIFGAGRDNYLDGIGISNDKQSNQDIMAGMGATQKENRTKITELNKLKLKLKNAYDNRTGIGGKEKVDKVKAEIKSKFPGMNLMGNAVTIGKTLTGRIDNISTTMSANKKKQDAMSVYVAKDKINTLDKRRGEALGYQNTAAQRVVDKAKADKAQAAAQKEYDKLWADGGAALLSDTSGSNIAQIGPATFNSTDTGKNSLVSKVGTIKRYDAWDQRRKYIGSELDERKTDLNRYYNSNYLQDFTVSDKDASQSMFGIDTPTGHSLAYNSMVEIGIDQKTPRTAIKSINQILEKTGTERKDYSESLAGIETKLLTLKEQQALKRKANKAVEADIARQVEADVSGGKIDVNADFRDKITGTSEELYDTNVQIAEHNTLQSYYSKSISQTDEDVDHLKDRLVEVTKVKNRNDYDTITSSGGDGDGGNRSRSSLGGYNKANRFRRSTGGKVQRTRGGRGNSLSGLVL